MLNADLTNANLLQANLLNANLAGADLKGADLRGAINITASQIAAANNEAEATYDQQIRQLLDLPLFSSSKANSTDGTKSNFLRVNCN